MFEWNYSVLGFACIAWTVLLGIVSYVCIRRRQQSLLEKIRQTNEMNTDLRTKNSQMEMLLEKKQAEESSNDESDEEEDSSPEPHDITQPILVSSDDIMAEAKSNKTAEGDNDLDPFDYCEHIQGEVKRLTQKVAQKKIVGEMSGVEMNEEREIQRQQMEAIFKLMAEKEGKFGISSIEDMQSQMKMYL